MRKPRRLILCALLVLTAGVAHAQAQYVDRTKITEAVAATATLQDASTANGDGATLDVSGYSSVSFVVTGTFTATVNFETTGDDTNWVPLQVVQVGTTTISTASTTTGTFSALVGSLKSVRARVSGYSSGSVTVTARANLAQSAAPQVITGTTQSNVTDSPTRDLGKVDVASLDQYTPVSGRLPVDPSGVTQPISAASLPLPAGAATSTKQSDGSQKTQVVDGSGNVIGSTSNALDVNIKSGNPTSITVTQATASNLNSDANLKTVSGNAVSVGNGASGTGVQRVTLASDSTGQVTLASGTTTAVTQPTASNLNADANLKTVGGNTVSTGNGVSGTGVQRVTIASDSTGQVALASGSNTIGALTANQSVNVAQINGATVNTGNGTASGSQRVTIASDSTGTVAATQSGTWTVQPGNTANTTAWITQPVPGTTNGASTCVVQSAASTNATNCKASAGLIYGIEVINTTSTIYYLRLYNLSSAPTCSSSTGFIRTVPIPHGNGTGAGVANFYTVGETYGTGIGFCLTGGGSSTDNTNAATGVYVTLHYK